VGVVGEYDRSCWCLDATERVGVVKALVALTVAKKQKRDDFMLTMVAI